VKPALTQAARAFASGIASKRGFQRDLEEWGRGLRDGENGACYLPSDPELLAAYCLGNRAGFHIAWVLRGADLPSARYLQ
jgi:hypothetical protein